MANELGPTQKTASANKATTVYVSKKEDLKKFEKKARKLVSATLLPKLRKFRGKADKAKVLEKLKGLHRDISTICDNLYQESAHDLGYKAPISKRESIEDAFGRLGKFIGEEAIIRTGDFESREGEKLISYKKDALKQIENLPKRIDYVADKELPSESAQAGGKAQENPNGKISTVK